MQKGWLQKRGGPRHVSKPFIEAGLLLQLFSKRGDREFLPSGWPDQKTPQAELHPQPLRDAMLRLLANKPHLNTSGHNGAVWFNARADRVNLLLAHLRKLKRSGPNSRCASMLTGLEYTQLADLLKLVQCRPEERHDALPLGNG